jgi:hypothetical protein
LNARKRRNLELAARFPRASSKPGSAAAYNDPEFRRREREFAAQHERAYELMVSRWEPKRPSRTG